MNFFRKKSPATSDIPKADPTEITPQSVADYLKRGYAYHARADYQRADEDFRQAISMENHSAEGHYALGLNLKAMGNHAEAIQAFQQALDLMNQLEGEDRVRAHMLTRITKGHINQLSKGDWDLRKEFWGGGQE